MRRSIIFICTLLCLSLCLTGCTGYRQIEPDENDLTVVGQVDGNDVYLEELRFVAYTYRDMMISRYGEGIFEGEDAQMYLSMLKDLVYSNITSNYAILLLCEEVRISQGEKAIIEKVDSTLSEMVEELGSFSKYKKYLHENHMTDHYLRFATEVNLLESELMYVYIDDLLLIEDGDEEIYQIIKDEFILVRHIFIPHTGENAKSAISEVSQRCANGETLSSLMEQYNQDNDMTTDGLFILDGYMTDEYEKVAFSLEVGEVSGIVEDYNGYYIIERVEMLPASIMLNFDYLKNLYQTYTFYSMVDEKQAKLMFVPNEVGDAYMSDPFNK